jgi:hypothetical protein
MPVPVPLPPPDTLLDVLTELGAGAGVLAVLGGGTLAALYGRRASISLSGEVHEIPNAFVVSIRPVVKAVGIFRVKLDETRGARVRLCEAFIDGDGNLRVDDDPAHRNINWWEHSETFRQQYVDPGEELTTSVVFAPLTPSSPSVVGWYAFLKIYAPTRLTRVRTAWWADQIFLPHPPAKGVPS